MRFSLLQILGATSLLDQDYASFNELGQRSWRQDRDLLSRFGTEKNPSDCHRVVIFPARTARRPGLSSD